MPTILHLTDLHFGGPGHYWTSESSELALPESDRRGLLGSLLRDLRKIQVTPDLIAVTGDLLDRGDASGVPLVLEFLAALPTRLALPRERVILVPGNHDEVRGLPPAERYGLYAQIYNDFYRGLRPPLAPAAVGAERVVLVEYPPPLDCDVVAFDSCERLDAATGNDHGAIGTRQRDRVEELLARCRGKWRIALMHHHLISPAGVVREDYSVMDDAPLLRRWLAENRFGIALHGHQHVDWQETHTVEGGSLHIAAGASAGVARYGRQNWSLPLGYQVLVLEDNGRGRRIRREYDPARREWTAAGRGPDVQPFTLATAPTAEARDTIPTAEARDTIDAVALYDQLKSLYSVRFNELLFRLNLPEEDLPPSSIAQAERAQALVRYFKQTGRDLGVLARALSAVRKR